MYTTLSTFVGMLGIALAQPRRGLALQRRELHGVIALVGENPLHALRTHSPQSPSYRSSGPSATDMSGSCRVARPRQGGNDDFNDVFDDGTHGSAAKGAGLREGPRDHRSTDPAGEAPARARWLLDRPALRSAHRRHDRSHVRRRRRRSDHRLAPDLVALTGDLVDGKKADLAHHAVPLAGLCARHGAYAVTGNHEYYCADPWIAHQSLGLRYRATIA